MRRIFPDIFFPVLAFFFFSSARLCAQNVIPFTDPRWKITGTDVTQETYKGKQCLRIVHGSALLPGANFTNGVIEFDMALTTGRYFPGMAFRIQDAGDREGLYVRPHQSGHPDAIQYFPEYNGGGGWQLYNGDGFSDSHDLPVDRWMHVRLLVEGTRAELYLDGEHTPALYIFSLYRPVAAGMIELENDGLAARYADFSYAETDEVTLQNPPRSAPPLAAGVIRSWSVSTPFSESRINERILLTASDTADLHWQTLGTDQRGVANLSMLRGARPDSNTVFARAILYADQPRIQKVSFGFTNRVRVYLNGQLLYAGHDEFQSRDYRFLGTIGYWDALYLPLKPGPNELWIAVSESDGGGWGVQAKVE